MARDLFGTLDLNLLKTLRVLSQEQNMRRAAERLFVTQPAVSQSLKKLRHHFGDELFVRHPRGLRPTAFTESLVGQVAPLLDELSAVLNEQSEFDPATLDVDLDIAFSPHLASFLVGPMFRRIRSQAPDARMTIRNWGSGSRQELLNGELQLGVNPDIGADHKSLVQQEIARDRFTLYARQGHPLCAHGDTLDMKDLDNAVVAVVMVPGWNTRRSRAEELMESRGYRLNVGFRSDLPGAAAEVVRHSDMLYPASSLVHENLVKGLHAFHVRTEDQMLEYSLYAYYHLRNRRNPMTLWLIRLVQDLLSG